MQMEAEPNEQVRITSADDAWSAMYEYGLKKSLGVILDYFAGDTETEHFINFCHSLDEDQLKEALEYFFGSYDQDKFIRFFKVLNVDQQAAAIDLLLHDVCHSKSENVVYCSSIIQFRKKFGNWKSELKVPKNTDEVIKAAQNNDFDSIIHYLWKNSGNTRKLVSKLKDSGKNMVLSGLALELMNYHPHQNEEHLNLAA